MTKVVKLPPTPCDAMTSFSSNRETGVLLIPMDVIEPSSIIHLVEEAENPKTKQLEHHYNFIDYFFEITGGTVRARTYLDSTEKVSVHLPKELALEHPDAARVLHYLARRFKMIERLGQSGYEEVPIESGGMIDRRTGEPVP